VIMRSRPTRASSTFWGNLPMRKPGILAVAARSVEACSTACFMWSLETSTSRRTRFSGSSSTFVFTMRPFCQPLTGLGFPLKKALREAEFMSVRARGAVFGGCVLALAAGIALLVKPGDTGDLPFFVHTSAKLFSADWTSVFANPDVQVGPLQLLVFRLGD